MRVSTYPDDPGYPLFQKLFHEGKRIEVFTRHRRLKGVLTADDAEGFAVVLAVPHRVALNADGVLAVVTEEVREDISIEVLPA